MTAHAVAFDLREDEQSAWIPLELSPTATAGDEIAVSSTHFSGTRTGVVAETVDDPRGRFHRVTFDDDGGPGRSAGAPHVD